jgi:hypothetical protein
MISIKRLRSVIQSTAHHAVSGLCYVHPHLGEECKKSGIKTINVNLMNSSFDPELPSITKELELSTNALREKFNELLSIEKIYASEIKSAYATFAFLRGRWPTSCYIEAVTVEGKKTEVAVDSSGKTAEILHASS